MRGDGDGWVVSEAGTHHWGVHGAAGLLLRAPRGDGTPAVLLQHRAAWSHQGGTWGLPGGALDSHEVATDAAVREAHEEAGLPAELINVHTSIVTATVSGQDGVTWTYTTVIADAAHLLPTVANRESAELRWVAENDVTSLPLHPAFALSWRRLRISAMVRRDEHACGLQLPHTVAITADEFGWCGAGAPISSRPPASH